jgi:NAD(P)-dependent dehydrogenase (short-subunit alcohol dehydrogenase family)
MSKPIAIVTGAATAGIGSAITRRLLADGYAVFGTYEASDEAGAATLATSSPDLKLLKVDHADRGSLDSIVASLPAENRVAALVNAQFFFAMEDPANFDFHIWDRSLAINLTAPTYLFHRLSPRFADGASVVTVTSTEGFIGSFGASAYAATKAAIHNLTKTLANVSGTRGIRVNSVAAGWIGGVMDTDEVFNMSRSITPLGRLGTPEEIAAVVAFLLSPESSFVNGSVLVADGGYTGVDSIAKFEFDAARKVSK